MKYTGRFSTEERLFMRAGNGYVTAPFDDKHLDPGSFCLYEEERSGAEADLGGLLADMLLGMTHDLKGSAFHVTLNVEEVTL